MIVELGEKRIDLTGLFPLKARDWLALEAAGVNLADGSAPVFSSVEVVFYCLHARDPSVTREDVMDLPLSHPAFQLVAEAMQAASADAGPLRTPSTSSAESTGGRKKTP